MNNKAALKQARKGITLSIKESPVTIIISRKPVISNGRGGIKINPYGVPVDTTLTIRLSHGSSGPFDDIENPAGLGTDYSRWALVGYKGGLVDGDIFEAQGTQWQAGPVDQIERFGGIIGYQAPLKEASA